MRPQDEHHGRAMADSPTEIRSDTTSHETLASEFRWRVPQPFNIAEAVCSRHARSAPQSPAVIEDDPEGGHCVVTFAELEARSNSLAVGLQQRGIGSGDRVAITLEQGADVLALHLACFKIGAISAPIASLYGTEGLAYRLNDCGARLLVTDQVGVAKLSPSAGVDLRARLPALEHIAIRAGRDEASAASEPSPMATVPGTLPLAELSTPIEDGGGPQLLESTADDPAILLYTSGTAGSPKGVLHAHRVLIGHLPGFQMVFDLAPHPGDVFWTPSVWSWVASLVEVVLPALYFGCPIVAGRERFSIAGAYRILSEHQVSCPFLAPAALRRMRADPPPADTEFALRTVMTGGEVSPPEVLEWTNRVLGATVNDIYGQTEANHIATGCRALFETPAGAIGKVVAGRRCRILDEHGTEVEPGISGEIALHRDDPIVMLEYWEQPQATAAKFGDGWIRTGDAGLIDADGFLYFQGRLDDMIMASGYRLGPEEVEGALLAHEAVMEAGVVGLPDPQRGEIVAACVRLKPGFDGNDDLSAELQDFVKTRLAAHARPRRLEFVSALPATSSGKTRRAEIRRQLLAGDA
ncbi:MAG TPA: AMP-binding protein [Acidobacteriota bacterium]|nr:AMP-binding protein [Acidobacteriota bacterium]